MSNNHVSGVVTVVEDKIRITLSLYTSNGEALPAWTYGNQFEGLSRLIKATERLHSALSKEADFSAILGKGELLLDRIEPGGSKWSEFVFQISTNVASQAIIDNVLKEIKMNPELTLFGGTLLIAAICWGTLYIGKKYSKTPEQGQSLINIANSTLENCAINLNLSKSELEKVLEDTLPIDKSYCKSVAQTVEPMRLRGGSFEVCTSKGRTSLPNELVQQMPSSYEIVDEPEYTTTDINDVEIQIVASTRESASSIWKVQLPEEQPFSKTAIKAKLDQEHDVDPINLMYREFIKVDLTVYSKYDIKKRTNVAHHVLIRKVYN